MKLNIQKRLAGQILKCSPKRVWLDNTRLDEIKESITKADIKGLINDKAIVKIQKKGVSRARAKKIHIKKTKNKKKGQGSRKGTANARLNRKDDWINRIRLQRSFITELRDRKLVNKVIYRDLYNKAKGGFFRSKRHIKLYLEEHHLIKR